MALERSFSARAKDEMCRRLPTRDCCAEAECYGALLFAKTFSASEIRVVTEHERFADRFCALVRTAGCIFVSRTYRIVVLLCVGNDGALLSAAQVLLVPIR